MTTLVRKQRRTDTLEGERLVRQIDILTDQLTKRGRAIFQRELRRMIGNKPIVGSIRRLKAGHSLTDAQIRAFDSVGMDRDRLQSLFLDAYNKGGRASSVVYENLHRFRPDHPRAVEWARNHVGLRIQEINESTRAGIQGIIANGLRRGTPPRQLAAQLESSVGLTFRQTQMVEEYRQRMLDRGMAPARANARAFDYGTKLRQQRIDAIAETEMVQAVEMGKYEYWQQGVDAGLLDETERLVWIAEQDDRVDYICEIMHGQETDIGGYFQTAYGPMRTPPLHPFCRCQIILGSGRRQSNRAIRSTDARRSQGQTPNRFLNYVTGHTMGKTETGDTYESLLYLSPSGQRLISRRFGGNLRPISNVAGGSRTTALDFEIPDSHAVELKTISARAANKKTAIKAEEKARKIAAAKRNNQTPLLIVQEVDDELREVTLYAHEGDFPSRRVTSMERLGTYSYTEEEFIAANDHAGHGGAKRIERGMQAARQALRETRGEGLGIDHPMLDRYGNHNPAIDTVMAMERGDRRPVWEMDYEEFSRISTPGIELTARTDAVASARPGDGRINLHPGFFDLDVVDRRNVMMHEVGHSLEAYVYQRREAWMTWEAVAKSTSDAVIDPRGGYEALAEAYSMLWSNPQWLRDNFPDAHRFLTAIVRDTEFPSPTTITKALSPHRRFRCGSELLPLIDFWLDVAEPGDHMVEKTNSGMIIYDVAEAMRERA